MRNPGCFPPSSLGFLLWIVFLKLCVFTFGRAGSRLLLALSPGEPGPLSGCGARAAHWGGSLVSGRALGHAGGPLQDEQQEA